MGSASSTSRRHNSSTHRRIEDRGLHVPASSAVQGTSNIAVPVKTNSNLLEKVQPEGNLLPLESSNASTKRVTFSAEGSQKSEPNNAPKNVSVDDQRKLLILTQYCEQTANPSHKPILTELAESVWLLASKADSNYDLLSPEASKAVKSVRTVYSIRPARHLLTGLAVDLGVPNLVYEIVSSLRNCYPDLAKWDREQNGEEPVTKEVNNHNVMQIFKLLMFYIFLITLTGSAS